MLSIHLIEFTLLEMLLPSFVVGSRIDHMMVSHLVGNIGISINSRLNGCIGEGLRVNLGIIIRQACEAMHVMMMFLCFRF